MFEDKIKRVIDKLCPQAKENLKFALLNNERAFSVFGINKEIILNHFLTQILHESQFLSKDEENLNYSAKRLVQVFPKYFKPNTNNDPKDFEKNPEKIGNLIYSNRYGNGTNEGYKFRGRGLIQTTFKSNYVSAYKSIYHVDGSIPNFVDNPELINDKKVVLLVACYFWNCHRCNEYASSDDLRSITKVINGGYNGLEERKNLLEKIKKI